jgi:hypothetical protein
MAYQDFTFTKLQVKFGIDQQSTHLFKNIKIVAQKPSKRLMEDINEGREMPIYSEKAKSEALIFPIIREVKRKNAQISIFSGYSFNVDIENELTGAPDFMISAKPNIVEPQRPIFCLLESKNKTPEEGFAQCAAEMYAARCFNQQTNEQLDVIYGAVTNAFDWVFLKLENNTVYIDIDRYFLNEMPKLLGILKYIVGQSVQK